MNPVDATSKHLRRRPHPPSATFSDTRSGVRPNLFALCACRPVSGTRTEGSAPPQAVTSAASRETNHRCLQPLRGSTRRGARDDPRRARCRTNARSVSQKPRGVPRREEQCRAQHHHPAPRLQPPRLYSQRAIPRPENHVSRQKREHVRFRHPRDTHRVLHQSACRCIAHV